MEVLLCKASIE